MLKIYLSGAISGKEAEAKKEFAEAERKLKKHCKDYVIINPFKVIKSKKRYSYIYYLKADIKELVECCYLINIKNEGWQQSKGAKLERYIAKRLLITTFNGVGAFIRFIKKREANNERYK